MPESVEYDAANQIRKLLVDDDRFFDVSWATAFRQADMKEGRLNAGYFSFKRDGKRYFVTVESAEPKRTMYIEDHDEDCAIRCDNRPHIKCRALHHCEVCVPDV